MLRRSILSAAERESLLALPDTKDELIRHYTFSETDLSIIRQRHGPTNRLGFAVQLCYLRFPGVTLGVDELPFPPLLKLVADQIKVGVESWLADVRRRCLDDLLKRRDNGKTIWLFGCASYRPSRIRGKCWNTSNASRRGRHSTYRLASETPPLK